MTQIIKPFQLKILLAFIITCLLQACSLPKPLITDNRYQKLNQVFSGREFVFRTDWYNTWIIQNGAPIHFCKAKTFRSNDCYKRSKNEERLLAQGGTVARITSVKLFSTMRIDIYFKTEQKTNGIIMIYGKYLNNWALHGPLAWEKITDQKATVSWVERELTMRTIRFLDNPIIAEKGSQDISSLPTPPKQLSLTPTSDIAGYIPSIDHRVTVSKIMVSALPEQVSHGQVLNLTLDYTLVDVAGNETEVTESRTLLYNNKPLPKYPIIKHKKLANGSYTTVFKQRIPSQAKPGVYSYEGEVCVDTGCFKHQVIFRIIP